MQTNFVALYPFPSVTKHKFSIQCSKCFRWNCDIVQSWITNVYMLHIDIKCSHTRCTVYPNVFNNINIQKIGITFEKKCKGTYSRSASSGMRRGTCCKSRCEQSTVWPVQVQTRGHFWSMLLLLPPPPIAVFAKFVPCTKMPTLPTLLNVPNDESPFPHGINCNSKITKLVVVAFTTQLSGGFFIFDIISHIYVGCCCLHQLSFG